MGKKHVFLVGLIVFVLRKYRFLSVLPAFLLVVIMLWLSVGENFRFLMEKNAIRKEIKRKIKQGVPQQDLFRFDLATIESDPGFYWVNDHEFSLDGHLFDVVHKEGNLLKCISDDQETVLFRDLDEKTRKDMATRNGSSKSLEFKLISIQNKALKFSVLAEERVNRLWPDSKALFGFTGPVFSPPEI